MRYADASKHYRKAIHLLHKIRLANEEEENRWNAAMLKLYLNMSQVSLKQVKPKKTIYFCKLVIDLEPQNVKAHFRYGQVLIFIYETKWQFFYTCK